MKSKRITGRFAATALFATVLLAAAGCSSGSGGNAETVPDGTETPAPAAAVSDVDSTIQAMLPQSILDAGVIRIGTSPNSPPSSQPQGDTTVGIIPDLAELVSKVLGVELEITAMDYAGLIPALQSDRIDANWSVINDTVERQETMDMVDFMRSDHGFLVLKGNPKQITSADALCGTAAGTVKGGLDQEFLEAQQAKCAEEGKPELDLKLYNTRQDIQTAMMSGNVDSFLGISTSHKYQANAVNDGEMFELADGTYIGGIQAIALLKDNDGLAEALQAALKKLVANGTYGEVLAKYDVTEAALAEDQIMINGVGNGLP